MRLSLAIVVAFLAFACGSNSVKETVVSESQLIDSLQYTYSALEEDISAQEILMYSEMQLEFAESLLKNYPESPALNKWLFEGGKAGRTCGEYERGIKLFDAYLQGGAEEKAAESLFLTAFIYDEDLKEKEKAEDYYKQLLEKYPDHELSDDAEALLAQLYMTEQEIIEMLMQKQEEVAEK